MRGVILRESDLLKSIFEDGEMINKPINTIRILAKHYLSKENVEETIIRISKLMQETYTGYKPSKWRGIIEQSVKSVHKTNNIKIIDINSIEIYESEWDNIIALEDRQLEKLAFILLAYQKINEIKNPDSNGWINNNLTDIFTEAKLSSGLNYKDKKLLLNKLYKLKYIKQKNTVDATSIQINFRDIEKKNKVKFTINNFNQVMTYFYEMRDKIVYTECEKCNKRIIKKNNRVKYCIRCAKQVNIEKTINNKNSLI